MIEIEELRINRNDRSCRCQLQVDRQESIVAVLTEKKRC